MRLHTAIARPARAPGREPARAPRPAAPGPSLQAKLRVGPQDDPLERQADRAAEAVLAGRPAPLLSSAPGPQRRCAECASEEEDELRLRAEPGGPRKGGVEAAASSVSGPGAPLAPALRAYFEPCFGMDLSAVRIHDGARAAAGARAIRARAFTLGRDIGFAAGAFAPKTREGRRLLAHELAHVVQQEGRESGVVQRAEVDDRSCAGLTDIETDVDTKVNAEIAAARTAAGTPPVVATLLNEVHTRLGSGPVSPIETFIENLPATKRRLPASSLAGTKFSGVGGVNRFYALQALGLAHVVGSAAKVRGICIGADKLGHFFGEGHLYYGIATRPGGTTAAAESAGRFAEITVQGLGTTGVYSNADLAANRAGLQFYRDLAANPTGLTFAIRNYITNQWNEQSNPSFYGSAEARVIWSNLLTGPWRGPFTTGGTTSTNTNVQLAASSGGSLTGTYEYPVASPTTRGTITNGTITMRTTSVSGTLGFATQAATPVSGVTIQYDWQQGTLTGKGTWTSVNEQTLDGTWGTGSSRTGGGDWDLNKV